MFCYSSCEAELKSIPNFVLVGRRIYDMEIRLILLFFEFLHFLRNDGMEDRYSVLIRLMNQLTADGFYCSFNGKKYSPGEVDELCMYS